MTTEPHHCEYLAAIAGLHEQTISLRALPAVGDFVSGYSGGRHWSGYVQQIEPGRMVVEVSGAWLVVDPKDITH